MITKYLATLCAAFVALSPAPAFASQVHDATWGVLNKLVGKSWAAALTPDDHVYATYAWKTPGQTMTRTVMHRQHLYIYEVETIEQATSGLKGTIERHDGSRAETTYALNRDGGIVGRSGSVSTTYEYVNDAEVRISACTSPSSCRRSNAAVLPPTEASRIAALRAQWGHLLDLVGRTYTTGVYTSRFLWKIPGETMIEYFYTHGVKAQVHLIYFGKDGKTLLKRGWVENWKANVLPDGAIEWSGQLFTPDISTLPAGSPSSYVVKSKGVTFPFEAASWEVQKNVVKTPPGLVYMPSEHRNLPSEGSEEATPAYLSAKLDGAPGRPLSQASESSSRTEKGKQAGGRDRGAPITSPASADLRIASNERQLEGELIKFAGVWPYVRNARGTALYGFVKNEAGWKVTSVIKWSPPFGQWFELVVHYEGNYGLIGSVMDAEGNFTWEGINARPIQDKTRVTFVGLTKHVTVTDGRTGEITRTQATLPAMDPSDIPMNVMAAAERIDSRFDELVKQHILEVNKTLDMFAREAREAESRRRTRESMQGIYGALKQMNVEATARESESRASLDATLARMREAEAQKQAPTRVSAQQQEQAVTSGAGQRQVAEQERLATAGPQGSSSASTASVGQPSSGQAAKESSCRWLPARLSGMKLSAISEDDARSAVLSDSYPRCTFGPARRLDTMTCSKEKRFPGVDSKGALLKVPATYDYRCTAAFVCEHGRQHCPSSGPSSAGRQ